MFNIARKWARVLSALAIGLILALSGVGISTAHANPGVANVVICGRGDPFGGCKQALIDTGHIDPSEPIATPWYPATIEPWANGGMAGSTDIGLPGVLAAINDFKSRGYFVRVLGYSQGSDLAIAAANITQVGELNLYGSPHPELGLFHGALVQAEVVEWIAQNLGRLPTDRPIPTNTTVHAYYGEGDFWANFRSNEWDAIQIINKLNDTLMLDGHWIQGRWSATCTFTDRYGVINHVTPDENPYTKNGCNRG